MFKYNEDETLELCLKYIETTYRQHYVSEDGVQLMDLFFSDPEEGVVFCKTNAMKYLSRFGKKEGNNKKDLLKAMHYIVLLMHCVEKMENRVDDSH